VLVTSRRIAVTPSRSLCCRLSHSHSYESLLSRGAYQDSFDRVSDLRPPKGRSDRLNLVSCPRDSWAFVAIKMSRRQGAGSGTYLNRYVTDEQRSRRLIFIATLRATAGRLFFDVARSSHMNLHMLVTRALKNSRPTSGKSPAISRTGH
jgi:hypothetical protein